MKHVADMVTGPGYGYLGHFSKRQWLMLGHNDVDEAGKTNDADDINSFVEQNGAQNAPGVAGLYTARSGSGNPL